MSHRGVKRELDHTKLLYEFSLMNNNSEPQHDDNSFWHNWILNADKQCVSSMSRVEAKELRRTIYTVESLMDKKSSQSKQLEQLKRKVAQILSPTKSYDQNLSAHNNSSAEMLVPTQPMVEQTLVDEGMSFYMLITLL